MRLHALKAGIAIGLVWGVYILGFTLISHYTGYGADFLKMWIPLHPGYAISFIGSLIGFGYGFVEGFAWAFIAASVYNMLVGKD